MAIDLSALAPAATQAVVGIGPAPSRSGSGTIIATDTVVTTAHNVGRGVQGGSVTVWFTDGRSAEGAVSAASEDLDLAVVVVDTADLHPVGYAEEEARIGQPIAALAAPGGTARLTAGSIAAVSSRLRTRVGSPVDGVIEHTAPLPPGASGGPVLDEHGRLLGMDVNRLGGGLYQAVAATTDLRATIEQLADGRVPERRRMGVAVARTREAAHLRAAVGLPPRDGVLITAVDEGSPAEAAGLARGDLITAVDGAPIRRPDDLLLAVRRSGAAVELTVERGADPPRQVAVSPHA